MEKSIYHRTVTNILPVLFILISVCLVVAPLAAAAAESNPADRDARIAFNFVDVEIPAVIKFISEITGYNFLFDDRIKGDITIIAPSKLSVDDSFNLFTSVLSLKGFTIVAAGPKTYKIIPSALARQSGMITTDEELPVNEGYISKLLPTQYIKADEALQFLRPVVSRDGHISAFGPGNMLLVVDSALNIENLSLILQRIDRPSVEREEAEIKVYFLEYADATDLAQVLQGIIKDLLSAYKTPKRAAKNSEPKPAPIISVTPDKATNSLIIVAPPSEYRNIAQVIQTLDKKRKQVFVEAMIVEARIDKLKDLGTQWRAMARKDGEPIVVGGFGNISSTAIQSIITGLTGFSAGGMGNFLDIPVSTVSSSGTISTQNLTAPGFAALFSLNEFRDAINVLSTPQILTSDNEEAEIVVGENVPFISQRERDLTTTNTVLSSIQRTDVGIMLRITPQITEGDYVKLNILQEISAVKDASDDILTTIGPTTTKRSTKTAVSVKDGQTVVIGGLMQETEEEGIAKTPILGDIPLIGWLFKFKSVTKNKTNLLVFLSPHIVKESTKLAQITIEKHNEFKERGKFYSKDELLIKFTETTTKERVMAILSEEDATVIKFFDSINTYHVRLKPEKEVEEAIRDFSAYPEVIHAEPNYKIKLPEIPPGPDRDMGKSRSSPGISIDETDNTERKDSSSIQEDNGNKERGPDDGMNQTESMIRTTSPTSTTETIEKQTVAAVGTSESGETAVQGYSAPSTAGDADPAEGDNLIDEQANDNAPDPEASSPVPDAPDGRTYYVQVGSWLHEKYAYEISERIRADYPETAVVRQGNFFKVRISGIASSEQGGIIREDLKKRYNVQPLLVQASK